jgi:hypothetical protein
MLSGCLQLEHGRDATLREWGSLLMEWARTSLNLHHGVGVVLLSFGGLGD